MFRCCQYVHSTCENQKEGLHPRSLNTCTYDSCSHGTYILEKLLKAVGTSGRKTSVTIKTINGEHTSSSMSIEDLQVANINNVDGGWIDLPKTYAKLDLPVDNVDITQPSQLKQ